MGVPTLNNIFYKPAIGAQGATEKGLFDDGLDVADGLIEANKPVNNKLSAFAATTSAELAGVISDETGSGKIVYSNSPVLVTPSLGAATAETINLTGGQIKFPSAQASSVDPNTLDDYEEGSWTMGVSFGGGVTGITYTSVLGYYTKIGSIVIVTGWVRLSSKGSDTGEMLVTGLPFNVASLYGAYTAVGLRLNDVTFANQFQANIRIGDTKLNILEITEGGVLTVLDDTNFSDTSGVMISCSYRMQ